MEAEGGGPGGSSRVCGGPGLLHGDPCGGGLGWDGCSGRGLGRSGDGLLTAPTQAARALPPSWTWSCSLGWGSEGRAEGDQDPQVGGERPCSEP